MGIVRTFRDINGVEWRVTHEAAVSPAAVTDHGWLLFQAGLLERRLAPFPANWQTATVQRLEQMCRVASAVQRTETLIASHGATISSDPGAEPTADTTPAGGSDAIVDKTAVPDHMSLLANAWPAPEARITFRG
jgi:hypothetical protein